MNIACPGMLFTCVLTKLSNQNPGRGSPLYGFIVHLAEARAHTNHKIRGDTSTRCCCSPSLCLSLRLKLALYKSEKDHNGSSIKGAIILSQPETVDEVDGCSCIIKIRLGGENFNLVANSLIPTLRSVFKSI